MFASSWRPLQALASTCDHPYSAHEDVRGIREASGDWASRKTAEFPPLLTARFADLVMPVFSPGQDAKLLSCEEALGMLPSLTTPFRGRIKMGEASLASPTGHLLLPAKVIIYALCDIFGLSGWPHITSRSGCDSMFSRSPRMLYSPRRRWQSFAS